MSEVLIHPNFPEEELNVIKANRVESMKVDDQRVESLARKQFNKLIFGENHPYGVVGEIQDIEPVYTNGFYKWQDVKRYRRILDEKT